MLPCLYRLDSVQLRLQDVRMYIQYVRMYVCMSVCMYIRIYVLPFQRSTDSNGPDYLYRSSDLVSPIYRAPNAVIKAQDSFVITNIHSKYHLYINNNPHEQSNIRERKRVGCRWVS